MSTEGFLSKLDDQIKNKIQQAGSWIYSVDGKTIIKITSMLSSLAILEPIGFLIPLIIDASDIVVRKRFLKHLPDLASKISNIDNLNFQFAESEEGQKLLKDTMKQIIHETNEDKIEYLKQFLVKTYSDENSNTERITNYLKILANMEPIHMKLLSVMRNPREIILDVCEQRKQNPRPEGKRPYGKLDSATFWEDDGKDDLNEFYLHSDSIVYTNGLKDLVTWNIIKTKFIHFWLYFQDSTFDTNVNSHIREIQQWTTPFGEEFLKYIHNDITEL